MSDYVFTVHIGTGLGSDFQATVNNSLYNCKDESYISTPEFSFEYADWDIFNIWNVDNANSITVHSYSQWGCRVAFSIQDIVNNGYIRCYRAVNATPPYYYGGGLFSGLYAIGGGTPTPSSTFTDVDSLPYGQYGGSFHHGNLKGATKFEISTNIPIFETTAEMQNYLLTGTGLKDAVNYAQPETSPDGEIFEVINMWTHGTWLNDTPPQVSGQPYYRNFRGKMVSGKFALYKIQGIDDGKLKMGIKNDAEFYEMEYSTDGINWHYTDDFPFEYFLRKRVDELGEFDYALTFSNSKIPIFKDDTDAQDYLDGNKDITDAENWNDIAPNYPISNKTGDDDEENTTMGEVYTRAFFSQQYICDVGAIQQISNALFDISNDGVVGMWENIKKGLEMYGENPVDAIQSCMFFPVDLTQVYQSVSVLPYIYFGGYKFDLQNGETVSKITFPNGHYDYGTFHVYSSFGGSWRDYAPYQRLYCYLPYIGWTELDIARYLDKDVRVWYYFDTRTGMCLACLFTNTENGYVLQDYFNGQCGVSMPITLTDFTSYANTQIQTLLGVGKGQMQNAINIGGMAQDLASKGVGASSIAMASASLGAVGVGIGATKALYGLTQNNINNFNKTKGGSSSMLNMCLPQEVCFMIETQQCDITPNELSLMGFPSNASGRLNDFSGYLEVDTVNLSCPYATENEKAEIVGLLKSGVYI